MTALRSPGSAADRHGDGRRAPPAGASGEHAFLATAQPLTAAQLASVEALEAALRARAPGAHGSTALVRQIATAIARALGLPERARELVDVCVRVRDVGMIGLPDAVVLSTGRLAVQDWELLCSHPERGAELLQSVRAPSLVVEAVRHHHERWDGEGYPAGLSGPAIPIVSRIIAVADSFVAIARDRPHRRGAGAGAALEHVRGDRDAQFDPEVADALVRVVAGSGEPPDSAPQTVTGPRRPAARQAPSAPGLREDMAAIGSLPAFALAHQRVMAATEAGHGDVVSAVEADLAVTLAVLSSACAEATTPVRSVSDAVAVLGAPGVRRAAESLPRIESPWRRRQATMLHQIHTHSVAVSRAAERIARLSGEHDPDTLITLGLLHDLGKVALAQSGLDYAESLRPSTATPEERAREERRERGFDHAAAGGLALTRIGLGAELADGVARHHLAESDGLAVILRLADMVVHHANADPISQGTLLRLASTCRLSPAGLQEVLLDLPHAGGSRRRRAEPSPLTRREMEVLHHLAQGHVYAEIAESLGLSVSTIRTHLHKTYEKLGVPDRAQAVLLATEMGWL